MLTSALRGPGCGVGRAVQRPPPTLLGLLVHHLEDTGGGAGVATAVGTGDVRPKQVLPPRAREDTGFSRKPLREDGGDVGGSCSHSHSASEYARALQW